MQPLWQIWSQKKILKRFADDNGFLNTRCYFNDGVSGTTFKREWFQNMISDISQGSHCKRPFTFGTGSFTGRILHRNIFSNNDVRFIAIYDNVDSANGDNEFAPFKNIFNVFFVRDTSNYNYWQSRRCKKILHHGNFVLKRRLAYKEIRHSCWRNERTCPSCERW